MYQHVLMLFNGPCPGMWGVKLLTGRSAGRARGYWKTGRCNGLLFRSENPDPDPWTMNYPHIPGSKRGILVLQGEHCQALTGPFIAGVHINAAKPWRGKTKRYCECNHLLHYLKLLWIFMKLTVDTRTLKNTGRLEPKIFDFSSITYTTILIRQYD